MRAPSSAQPTRTSLPGHPVILTRPSSRIPARNGACSRSRSAAVADRHRTVRRCAAKTSGLSGSPCPTFRHRSSSRTVGPISASQITSRRSPWASSEMQDRLRVWRSPSSPRNASTSHGRPRSSTKLPCSIVSPVDPCIIFLALAEELRTTLRFTSQPEVRGCGYSCGYISCLVKEYLETFNSSIMDKSLNIKDWPDRAVRYWLRRTT
jgi:hypothetical protein